MDTVACILLAAGRSSRFGSDKMLHPMPDGMTVLASTAQQYLSVFKNITVVVSCVEDHPLSSNPEIQLIGADSAKGMSESLKTGIRANPDCKAWLIALGDMPYILAATIGKLRDTLSDDKIVVPMWQQRQGNPVGFGRSFRDQLLSISGDRGAKSILKQYPESIVEVPTPDRGVMHDIDFPTDLL